MLLLFILYTDNIQGIILQLLLHQRIKFAFMLKISVGTVKTTPINRVRHGKRNLEFIGLLGRIIAQVQLLGKRGLSVKMQTPKDDVVSTCVEQEYDQHKNSQQFLHRSLGMDVHAIYSNK